MAWPGLAWPGLAWPGLAWHDDLYIARTLEFCLSEEQHGRGNLLPKMAIRQHKAPRTPDVKKLGVRITRSHARTKKQLSANSKRHAFSIKKTTPDPFNFRNVSSKCTVPDDRTSKRAFHIVRDTRACTSNQQALPRPSTHWIAHPKPHVPKNVTPHAHVHNDRKFDIHCPRFCSPRGAEARSRRAMAEPLGRVGLHLLATWRETLMSRAVLEGRVLAQPRAKKGVGLQVAQPELAA